VYSPQTSYTKRFLLGVTTVRPLVGLARAATLVAGTFVAGCATIFSGGSETAQVSSDPEGAKCQVGGYTVVTPGQVPVKRSSHPVQVVCKKNGYEDGYGLLDSEFNGVAIANLIFIIPWVVDLATGNAWGHDDAVNVMLTQKDSGKTETATAPSLSTDR